MTPHVGFVCKKNKALNVEIMLSIETLQKQIAAGEAALTSSEPM